MATMAGQQPNFDLLGQCFVTAGSELSKCSNMPAIAGGVQIMNALERLTARLDAMERNINQRIDAMQADMNNRFDRLDQKQAASDHNNIARLQNSIITHPGTALYALHHYRDNVPIDGFPPTAESITGMNAEALRSVLTALNAPTSGTVTQKRQNLRLHVGLQPLPA